MNYKVVVLGCAILCASLVADEWHSATWVCKKGSAFERHVELNYETQGTPVPCDAYWYRDIEEYQQKRVLFKSLHGPVGACQNKVSRYLTLMDHWGVSCEKQAKETTQPTVAEIPAPPPAVSEPDPVPVRTPASENLTISEPRVSAARWGSIDAQLGFSQAVVNVTSNGNGTFASDALSPGAYVTWRYRLPNGVKLVASGSIEHMGFQTTSATDTFDAPSPWFWSAKVGAEIQATDRLSLFAGPGLTRRLFIRRENTTTLAGDPGTIPELSLAARYWLGTDIGRGLYVGAESAYLLPASTTVSHAHSGISIRGEAGWGEAVLGMPCSVGLNLERTVQDSDLVEESSWTLGLLFGFRFDG